jgi:signal transduction histidine kinase
MSTFFSQVSVLLTGTTGNLIYQLVLVFSIAGALEAAFTGWRARSAPQLLRTVLGLGLLLGLQILVFVIGGLSLGGILDPAVSLPPLERAVMLISLIWVIWLWAFPEPSPQPDAGAVILGCLAAAVAALSLLTWRLRSPSLQYNGTIDDIFWQLASLGTIALGGFLLIIRRTEGFINGLAFLGLAFLGHVIHLVVHESGSYSAALRLAYMAAFPLLLTLPQRFHGAIAPPVLADGSRAPAPVESKRYGADPKTLHALVALASQSGGPERYQAITRAIAHSMLADLCFLLLPTQDRLQIAISNGYDLIREEDLPATEISSASIPRLADALQRGRSIRLPASPTSDDTKGLAEVLGLNSPGNLLAVPFSAPEQDSLGGVLLLTPYSQRVWTSEDESIVQGIAASLAPMLGGGAKASDFEHQAEQAASQLEASAAKIALMERRNSELVDQLAVASQRTEKGDDQSLELEGLRSSQARAQTTIEGLQGELAALRSSGAASGTQLEEELKAALRDVAGLQNQVAESNRRVLDLESGGGGERRKKEQAEIIASISQELRQPMSSIIGYTDLLLGESIGILGALQRKFIERIKAATERIGSLINDMIQLNTLEVGLTGLKAETMDLNVIIDNALAYTSSQVREKNISIHLDLPKKVAPVSADREALQQILIHLLQNAGAATPLEGTIRLKVSTTRDDGQAYVMIQVTDSGGGIPEEDLPRVFTRLYRADNVLIQGVGDTGVGLSIAKTLTEAQQGRIWVETEPGTGATFNVLLPMARESADRPPWTEAA